MSHDGRPPTYAACEKGTCHCDLARGVRLSDLFGGDGPYPPQAGATAAGTLDAALAAARDEQRDLTFPEDSV